MKPQEEELAALGQPAGEPTQGGDADFAAEHETTAVDRDITAGRTADDEPESPPGWSGMERDGPP